MFGQSRNAADTRQTPRADAKGKPVLDVADRCTDCGIIEAVRAVRVPESGTDLDAVAGSVTGAAVGSQFGRGNGRTVLGVLGAVGGAYSGNSIESGTPSQGAYRVSIRMDDGTLRTIDQARPPAVEPGAKVRLIDEHLATTREMEPG